MPKSSRKLLQSADDITVDELFSNTNGNKLDDLINKMQQMLTTASPHNPNHGGRGFTKHALAAVGYLKHGGMFVVHHQCHSHPLGIEVFTLALVVMMMAQKGITLFI